jgi:hypothetical protein
MNKEESEMGRIIYKSKQSIKRWELREEPPIRWNPENVFTYMNALAARNPDKRNDIDAFLQRWGYPPLEGLEESLVMP